MAIPEPEDQVQFLFKIQRLLSEGAFVSTYKFALLLALADLAVERGDDTTESLPLDTVDLAEKFVALYWRQVLPWVGGGGEGPGERLHQASGETAAILDRIEREHRRFSGALPRLQQDRAAWAALTRDVARVIAVMPLWKLQTVGGQRLDFLYPNLGRGRRISLRGDAVYCLRRFRGLIGDLAETAWVRFIRRLRHNRPLLGGARDLRDFLFGADRAAVETVRPLLREWQSGRCFYCDHVMRGEAAVDHFIPWSLYPLDLGQNYVLADSTCNGNKSDRLAACAHLVRWSERNRLADFRDLVARSALAESEASVRSVTLWAYSQAESVSARVWLDGRDGMVPLDPRWRSLAGLRE